jgi:hypothetical protein
MNFDNSLKGAAAASRLALAAALALLSACAGGAGGSAYYSLVRPGPQDVARDSMRVAPTMEWNRARRTYYDISREENWTLNGPLLDSLTFVGGLEPGRTIVRQRRRDERQVPLFRADMSPQEIASLIESFYRIRAGSVRFETTGLRPRPFLGHPGFQFDYDHLDSSETERRGRAVGAVVDGRLYLVLLEGTRLHYFPAALPEFERIVESATLTAGS